MKNLKYIIPLAIILLNTGNFASANYFDGAGVIQSEIQKQYVDEQINKKIIEQDLDVKIEPQKDDARKVKPKRKDNEEVYDPAFTLNQLIIEGNTIFKDEELKSLASLLVGNEVYIEDIMNLATAITKRYHYKGYVTSFAYIPEQDVVDGVVTVRIVESKVNEINIEGNKWTRNQFFKYGIMTPCGLKKDKIFNVKDVDASMKAIKSTSYIKGNINVSQSETFDSTEVTLNVKDRMPWSFNVGWDDSGRDLVGVQRARLTLANENLTGFGDKIYGGVVLASGTKGVLSGYQLPVSPWGTRLAFDYGYTEVNLGGNLSDLKMSGKSTNYMLRLIQPIIKKSRSELEASVGIDFSNTNSNLGLLNVNLTDYSLRVLRAAVYGTHDDNSGRTFASVTADFGLGGSGSSTGNPGSPETMFTKYGANIIRLQSLPLKDSYLILRLCGQYSPDSLFPIEQLQLGGVNSVRGYEPGALLADYGVNGGVEFRTPIPGFKNILPERYKNISDKFKLLAFYDFGYAKENGNMYNNAVDFLHSVGAGMNVFFENGISLNLAVGIPVGSRDYTDGSARFHFALSSDIDRLLYRRFYKEAL